MEEVREGEIITPDKFKARVERLLSVNREVVVNSDKKKTHLNDLALIILKLYRIAINKKLYWWMKRK